jgi:23S rRNA (cytosine1962-C5)-methyltransferase
MKSIRLKPGKERAVERRHPWVFSGAIAKGGADMGETVRVEADDGRFLAWAAYSPASSIKLRVWSFTEGDRIDADLIRTRIDAAVAFRARLDIPSDAMRLVHAEADGLPGLIVDRYGDVLVAQFLSAGAERWRRDIIDALMAIDGVTRLFERSDSTNRKLEGLEGSTGWINGDGDSIVEITEHGWRFAVDVAEGHKTGHYLDQRDNRAAFARLVSGFGCARVLNCHAYTGGFAIAALSGGAAEVVSVDSSCPALSQAEAHVALNGFDPARARFVAADANAYLREQAGAGEMFDAIVLDPPKFAATVKHADRAARAYKDLNRVAFKALAPGGMLMTYSCSGAIGTELFQKIAASAALEAGVDAYVLHRLEAAPDHPMTLAFPEGEYLKGLVVLRR